MNKFYLTTAIDYVNGKPHIGHAYEKILCDVICRHFSQRIDDVYFLTGTDEHGIKIQKTADSREITPQQLCDENSSSFQQTWADLGIEYSDFIRTTQERHKKTVQKIFKKLVENGDIYKHSYKGLYCSGCESFLNARDLTADGLCPDHLKKPEEVFEENYFFKLTKYKDAIIKHIKDNPKFLQPDFKVNEVIKQLENIEYISADTVIKQAGSATVGNAKLSIPLAGLIDIDTEIARQNKKLEKLSKEKFGLENRLNNKNFVEHAPEEVLAQTKNRIEELTIAENTIKELINSLTA